MNRWIPLFFLMFAGMANAQQSSTSAADLNATPNACGALRNPAFGPFDYRSASPDQRSLVEGAHFTPGVESLNVRKTGAFGHDIGYTLRAFPNHPRALAAMERLVAKEKRNPPEGAPYTIDCFYERALRFQPGDHVVRLLFANFLVGRGQTDEATRHLVYVAETQADNPFALHNAGLIYFDMKNYDAALAHAHKAMQLGLMRTDLKARLEGVRKWVDPTPEAQADAASAPGQATPGAR